MRETPAQRFLGSKPKGGGVISAGGCLSAIVAFGLVVGCIVALSLLARDNTDWQQVEGVIVSSQMGRTTYENGDESWQPAVTYQYVAANRQLTGETIQSGANSYNDRARAEEVLARYPVGQPVVVYYDPVDPERAVLEKGVNMGAYAFLGVGLVVVILGLVGVPLLYLFGRRKRKSESPSSQSGPWSPNS
jgi:hypothetical protein